MSEAIERLIVESSHEPLVLSEEARAIVQATASYYESDEQDALESLIFNGQPGARQAVALSKVQAASARVDAAEAALTAARAALAELAGVSVDPAD